MTRALRIGVLLGGNLVEEKLFRGTSPITFGQSLHCSLSIPGDGIPHEHVLFAYDQGRLILRATPTMSGRFAHGATSTAITAGDMPLPREARGKLVIGDATLLFQELAAAPLAPRPVLPASVRGTLADRIDRRLAVIIGASVAVHLGIAGYAWLEDLESTSLLETPVAMTYRHDTIEVSIPDEPTPAPAISEPAPGPGTATPVTPTQTPKPVVTPTRVTPGGTPPGMSIDDAQRFASILTGAETGATGAGPMKDRNPGADLGSQIDDVGSRPIGVGNTGSGFRDQPGPRIGTNTGPNITDPTQVASNTPKTETGTGGRIQVKPQPIPGGETTLTVAMVLDRINTVYMAGLQRCYKKGLVDDATLAGKISMTFTVGERGMLDEQSAAGVSSGVDSCVSQFMTTWKFPTPKDKDGDPTEQSFKMSLQLTPN